MMERERVSPSARSLDTNTRETELTVEDRLRGVLFLPNKEAPRLATVVGGIENFPAQVMTEVWSENPLLPGRRRKRRDVLTFIHS